MKSLGDKFYQVSYWVLYRLACCWWWCVRQPGLHGVFVAVWWDDQVLLIRNSYKREYSLPGGMIRRDEDWPVAAARELAEEVGIVAAPAELQFWGAAAPEPGRTFGEARVFELTLAQPPVVQVDNREVVWAEFLAPTAALARPLCYSIRRYLEATRPAA
jgi:8-oxo-dGTP diphosphatase